MYAVYGAEPHYAEATQYSAEPQPHYGSHGFTAYDDGQGGHSMDPRARVQQHGAYAYVSGQQQDQARLYSSHHSHGSLQSNHQRYYSEGPEQPHGYWQGQARLEEHLSEVPMGQLPGQQENPPTPGAPRRSQPSRTSELATDAVEYETSDRDPSGDIYQAGTELMLDLVNTGGGFMYDEEYEPNAVYCPSPC